ncbi:MAG: hypothetical protein C0467_28670 [Planctomycetaceae bacterium]|nr:hypothetical protein [Planctomycetaceae bacterium]
MPATFPTFAELLPPTKSAPHAGIRWTLTAAGKGLLSIEAPRKCAVYVVVEFQTAWAGRAFHFECLGGQSDKDSLKGGYDVFIGRPHETRCDCKGWAYGRGKPCRHIAAVRAIIENGWMDCPANLDADSGNTEPNELPETI